MGSTLALSIQAHIAAYNTLILFWGLTGKHSSLLKRLHKEAQKEDRKEVGGRRKTKSMVFPTPWEAVLFPHWPLPFYLLCISFWGEEMVSVKALEWCATWTVPSSLSVSCSRLSHILKKSSLTSLFKTETYPNTVNSSSLLFFSIALVTLFISVCACLHVCPTRAWIFVSFDCYYILSS